MEKIGFSACDNPNHKGKTNTWYTPKEITESLGSFFIDPCTNSTAPHYHALHNIKHDKGQCGLSIEWRNRVWLNPPYGKDIVAWLDKLLEHGNGMALVFARTETKWAQKHMKMCTGFNLLKGRISFISDDGRPSTNASNGSMLLAYGAENFSYLHRLEGNVYYNGNDL